MRRFMVLLGLLAGLAFCPAAFPQNPYVGEIRIVAFNFAPVGWAECQGQLLQISQNPALFTLVGTTYGGDGVSTFALPDLRGRTAIHQGSTGYGSFVMGQQGGLEQVTLTVSQMPAHTHQVYGQTTFGNSGSPAPSGSITKVWATQSAMTIYSGNAPDVAMSPEALATVGSGQPIDIHSPYLVLNYIISLFGVFPSQT